jgi:hypothetical protein
MLSALRGPKKKGKDGEVGLADTTDIINIYKEQKDPVSVLPSHY